MKHLQLAQKTLRYLRFKCSSIKIISIGFRESITAFITLKIMSISLAVFLGFQLKLLLTWFDIYRDLPCVACAWANRHLELKWRLANSKRFCPPTDNISAKRYMNEGNFRLHSFIPFDFMGTLKSAKTLFGSIVFSSNILVSEVTGKTFKSCVKKSRRKRRATNDQWRRREKKKNDVKISLSQERERETPACVQDRNISVAAKSGHFRIFYRIIIAIIIEIIIWQWFQDCQSRKSITFELWPLNKYFD